jgi:hypothetical protein
VRVSTILAMVVVVFGPQLAAAQFKSDRPAGSSAATQFLRVGMIVTGTSGAFKSLKGTTSAPSEWPEQQLRVASEDLSPGVKVTYQMVDEGARQMTITIPGLAPSQEVRAVVTFAIDRTLLAPPRDPDKYTLPNPNRLDRKLAVYLTPSPQIESDNPEIIALAKRTGADAASAWSRVEALYDLTREKVRYEFAVPVNGAAKTLKLGVGDCDDMSNLFVALCRAAKTPARLVRVPQHCYAEFYLLDPEGVGHWFPCQLAGTRAFGGMPDPRPILQKGDKVLGIAPNSKRKELLRFLPTTFTGIPVGKAEAPRVQFICELVKEK